MSVDEIVALLARIPIFGRLSPAQMADIARQFDKITFRPGQFITESGAPGNAAYLLVAGGAEDSGRLKHQVPLGSLIGELAMLVAHNHSASIVAKDRVHCLMITRESMHSLMMADPLMAEHFSEHIRQRLQKMANSLKRIDHVLERRNAVPMRQPAFLAAQPAAGAAGILGRMLRPR